MASTLKITEKEWEDICSAAIERETDPTIKSNMEENYALFRDVVRTRNITPELYMNALKYICLRNMGQSVYSAWSSVFPDRADKVEIKAEVAKAEGREYRKEVNAYAYAASVTVKLLEEYTQTPNFVLFAPEFKEAIMGLMDIGRNEKNNVNARVNAFGKAGDLIKGDARSYGSNTNITNVKVQTRSINMIQALSTQISELVKKQSDGVVEGKPITEIMALDVDFSEMEEDEDNVKQSEADFGELDIIDDK